MSYKTSDLQNRKAPLLANVPKIGFINMGCLSSLTSIIVLIVSLSSSAAVVEDGSEDTCMYTYRAVAPLVVRDAACGTKVDIVQNGSLVVAKSPPESVWVRLSEKRWIKTRDRGVTLLKLQERRVIRAANKCAPLANKWTGAPPRRHVEGALVVLIPSRRTTPSEPRGVIRATWKKGFHNAFFIVGAACPVPPAYRANGFACEKDDARGTPDNATLAAWVEAVKAEDRRLELENELYGDMLRVPSVDVYRQLVHKIVHALDWALRSTNASWFMKVDDDAVARIGLAERYLTEHHDADEAWVVGDVIKRGKAPRNSSSKWFDPCYSGPRYPLYPNGHSGWALSRPAAQYIVDNAAEAFRFANEDAMLGIMFEVSVKSRQLRVKYANRPTIFLCGQLCRVVKYTQTYVNDGTVSARDMCFPARRPTDTGAALASAPLASGSAAGDTAPREV